MKRKSTDSVGKIFTKEIVFETKSGSIGISTDGDGRLKIGAVNAPGTANTLVIDPINNKIQTSEVRFTDGTNDIELYKKVSGAGSSTQKLQGTDIKAETSFRINGFYKV
jgi:hypothetical protein